MIVHDREVAVTRRAPAPLRVEVVRDRVLREVLEPHGSHGALAMPTHVGQRLDQLALGHARREALGLKPDRLTHTTTASPP
jgi:hypothetical protein